MTPLVLPAVFLLQKQIRMTNMNETKDYFKQVSNDNQEIISRSGFTHISENICSTILINTSK
jgi:hypothetical protein